MTIVCSMCLIYLGADMLEVCYGHILSISQKLEPIFFRQLPNSRF